MKATRRDFVNALAAGAGWAVLPRVARAATGLGARAAGAAPRADGWDQVPEILKRIQPPVFPDRTFDAGKFGTVADGVNDCTDALQRAIDACHDAGGGRVMVPSGRVATGPLRLRSNVNLVLKKGTVLAFSTDPRRFPLVLTRFEGVEVMNYAPLLYAYNEENIAITGEGTLDGGANCMDWWSWKGATECSLPDRHDQAKGRKRLFDLAEKGVPVAERVFGQGWYLRPSFVQPYACRNVLIDGVTIVNSPMWVLHPVLCTNVTIRNVTVASLGPNNDGCDVESCRDVLIEGCTFNDGDDCVVIKSGRNADGRRLHAPCENVIVRKCTMRDGHGGVTIGSEISGDARRIFVEDCTMSSPRLDRGIRLKTNAMRGGVIEEIYVRRVQIGEVAESVLSIDFTYEEGATGSFMPTVRGIDLRDVTSEKSDYALFLKGFEQAPITDVRLSNCTFNHVAKPSVVQFVKGLAMKGVRVNGRRASA
jgi:polygalacturonase